MCCVLITVGSSEGYCTAKRVVVLRERVLGDLGMKVDAKLARELPSTISLAVLYLRIFRADNQLKTLSTAV